MKKTYKELMKGCLMGDRKHIKHEKGIAKNNNKKSQQIVEGRLNGGLMEEKRTNRKYL